MKYKYININNIDNRIIDKFYLNLDKNNKEHIDNILDEKKRKESITGLILLSELLKEINIPFEKVKISRKDNGKPYITNYDIYFNISHSFDYVICAISKEEIGVDIEKIRNIDESIFNFFKMKRTSSKNFFKFFTKLESFTKMNGESILDNLDKPLNLGNCNFYVNTTDSYVFTICTKESK